MKYAVIDIGSNTIKGFVYDENYNVIDSMHFPSKLINYVNMGIMSSTGIDRASEDILKLKEFLSSHCERIYAYATSATRDCTNCDEIITAIKERTGIDVDVLTGKAEALCDAKAAAIPGINHFLCIDLGGGSAQICEFKDNNLLSTESRPIGALRVKTVLSGDNFPIGEMKEKVISHINDQMNEIKSSENNLTTIIMGGASHSCSEIMNYLGIGADYSENDAFILMYEKLESMPDDERTALLKEKTPLRSEILGYALLILDTILKHCNSGKIMFTKKGSREGYLAYKLEGMDFALIR